MESLHNDGLAGGIIGKGSLSGGGRRINLDGNFLRLFACWLLCGITIWFGAAQAQTTYVHDANGRVVAVTQNDGTTAQYTYDALGHAGQISAPITAGQLGVFAFTPTHGEAGTQVTIQGHGFDSNAANDTVSFNGSVAAVLSASATQIVTTVPMSATTGAISVMADGQTVASATPFLIDDTGVPPNISQVAPEIVAVGSVVTVTGTHLDPITGDTAVWMGGVPMLSVSSMSDTQLQYTVPDNAVSGHIVVQTPYGTATSAPVALLPSNIVSATSGASSTYLVANGNVVSLSNGVAGKPVALTFDAHQGDTLELTFNDLTITGSSSTSMVANVYGPTGAQVLTYTCSTTNPGASCRLPLDNLAVGTYSVVVSPPASSVISFNAILELDTIGPQLTPNVPTSVNLAAGEVERLTFTANAGDAVALQLSGVTTTPAGQSVYVQVYPPSEVPGTNTLYTVFNTTTATTVNLTNLPASGTYTAVVSIISGTPGSAQLTLAPSVIGTEIDNGAVQSYRANIAGENIYLTFTANQGDSLELTLNDITITGSSSTDIVANVYGPSGAQVLTYTCYTTNPGASCRLPLGNLAAGTYSVVVLPPTASSVISFNAILEPNTVGPELTLNVPMTVNLAAGEVELVTFTANAGDTVALRLSGVSTTPGGQNMYLQVLTPGAGAASSAYATFYSASSTTGTMSNVPGSGTYTVIVSIIPGTPGSAQLTLESQ